MPFALNKNAKELGIDTTRKFKVVEEYSSNYSDEAIRGDILELVRDDGSSYPIFKNITKNRGADTFCWHWSSLEYADNGMTLDEIKPLLKPGMKIKCIASKCCPEAVGTIDEFVGINDNGNIITKNTFSYGHFPGAGEYSSERLEIVEESRESSEFNLDGSQIIGPIGLFARIESLEKYLGIQYQENCSEQLPKYVKIKKVKKE